MVEMVEIIIPEPQGNLRSGIISRLIEHPIEIQDFVPLSREEIYE